jgi:glycosyltransferase involved in cell wall biosynthesis
MVRILAVWTLAGLYGAAALFSRLARRAPRPWQPSGCILVIGTFHNPNWFHSHIRPLARSGVGEVILVCDEPVEPMPGVRFACPPRWLARVATRAGAKLAWSLVCAVRYRPDLYMGYHIFPCALIALVVARLAGRPACYQDTSGPLELEGGGWNAENALLTALQRPSALVERRVNAVVREFDSVVVRGSGAEAYVRGTGYAGSIAVITGSVEPAGDWQDHGERSIDLAFVGRLTEYKKPERFIAVVAAVAKIVPRLRAVVVGEGPDATALKALARELGMESNVEFLGKRTDVDQLLAASRVFVLTSRWEGLSIAMLEAMCAGTVPVVANVGDLADFIDNGANGFIVAQDDIGAYAGAAVRLLRDADFWRRCSRSALERALEASGTDAIARRWQRHLALVVAKARTPSERTTRAVRRA